MNRLSIQYLLSFTFLVILSALTSSATAQDVRLTNPSFEDTPRRGVYDPLTGERSIPIKGWMDCGAVLFRGETPPDIHDGKSGFWKTEVVAAHGKTYMTMVVRDNYTYETVTQPLMGTLKRDKCYKFSIGLVQSKTYLSATKKSRDKELNFTQPAVLRVWGGKSPCDSQELLAESAPVDNNAWENYEFIVRPQDNYTYLTLEAYWVTPLVITYNGHICIDNASHFIEVDCNNPDPLVAEASAKDNKPVPSFKRKKKKQEEDKMVINLEKKEEKVDTIVYKRPKKKTIEGLDIRKLAIGQMIQLPHLHFDADTSAINDKSYQTLNELYTFLNKYKEVNIEVGGHTNNAPPDEYCDKLSTARAEAVANYLISKGIESDRIAYKGYGKRRPLATNATAAGRKKNQRVQIKITSLG